MSQFEYARYEFTREWENYRFEESGLIVVERLCDGLATIQADNRVAKFMQGDIVRLENGSPYPKVKTVVRKRYPEQTELSFYYCDESAILVATLSLSGANCFVASDANPGRRGSLDVYHDGFCEPIRVAEAIGFEQSSRADAPTASASVSGHGYKPKVGARLAEQEKAPINSEARFQDTATRLDREFRAVCRERGLQPRRCIGAAALFFLENPTMRPQILQHLASVEREIKSVGSSAAFSSQRDTGLGHGPSKEGGRS